MPIIFEEYHSKRHKKPFGSKTIVIDSNEALSTFINNPTQYENIYTTKDMATAMKARMLAEEDNLPQQYIEAYKKKYVGFSQLVQNLDIAREEVIKVRTRQSMGGEDDSDDDLDNARSDIDDDDFLDEMNALDEDPEVALELDADGRETDAVFRAETQRENILTARELTRIEPVNANERRFDTIALSMDSNQYDFYKENFRSDPENEMDPFSMLASYITSLDDDVNDLPGHGQTYHFKRHLDHILPVMSLVVNGSRREYQECRDPAQKAALLDRMEAFEAISGMLQSLRALANNKSRYTEGYFNTKLKSILGKLDELGVAEQTQGALLEALNQVASKNLVSDQKADRFYQHKKGSTAFDASGDKMEIKGHQKRLKIEHHKSPDSGSIVVTGKFNYSRKSVIGVQTGHFTGVKKIFAQQKDQRNEMKDQVSDFVTTALFDFQKGTEKNPIYLQPSKGNQSELSLAILLEFKKRAILEGKELIAADDKGKRITITPNPTFTPDEKAYFQSFALQIPKVEVGRGKLPVEAEHCAGFQLLQEVKLSGKRLKEQEYSEDTIVAAMTQHLTDTVAAHVKEQGKSIDAAIKSIPPQAGIDSKRSSKMNV